MDVSNWISEYAINGLNEILGPESVADFTRLMETHPTEPFVCGMLMRAGRAGFYYWLKQEKDALEKANLEFRFSPVNKKIHAGLKHLCNSILLKNRYGVEFKENEKSWELALTAAKQSEISPLECSFFSGLAQELACWAGMGKLYQVRGMGCKIKPAGCGIIIEKTPVE